MRGMVVKTQVDDFRDRILEVPHSCGSLQLSKRCSFVIPRGGHRTEGTPACPTQGSLVTLGKCLLLCRPQFLF